MIIFIASSNSMAVYNGDSLLKLFALHNQVFCLLFCMYTLGLSCMGLCTVQLPGRFYKPCVLQGFLILFTEEKLKTRMDFACVPR